MHRGSGLTRLAQELVANDKVRFRAGFGLIRAACA